MSHVLAVSYPPAWSAWPYVGVGVGVGVGVRVSIGVHTLESLRLPYPLMYVLYAMYIYTTHTYPLTYVRIHTCMHIYIVGHAHVNTYTQWHP